MQRRGGPAGPSSLVHASCAALVFGLALLTLGCSATAVPDAREPDPDPDHDRLRWPDPLEHFPRGDDQLAVLCARDGDDPVRSLFCGDEPFEPRDLIALQEALRIDAPRIGGITGISLTANSTALSTRSVSAINPRLIAVRVEQDSIELLALAFARGEQSVEMVVRDRQSRELRFYLLAYRQDCNERDRGCRYDELLTPVTESDWTETSLYDEEDLKNTVLDCRACHQPEGPGTPRLLRMQERLTPWTHWLWKSSLGGRVLLADYFDAHGDEPYAGMPSASIDGSHPGNLAALLAFSGKHEQPNEFAGGVIEAEVLLHARELGGDQPHDNSVPGASPTWDAAYERALRGEAIPVPYHDVKVSDETKLAAMTEAYLAWRRGELEPGELPDIRDVYPDDPLRQAEMGFTTLPGLSGEEVLVQACSQCHNARLDPSISRAAFHTDLDSLARGQKDTAIERLKLPATDPKAMPPRRIRYLSDEARERLIELLER
jgi:hypothetical protein